MALSEQERQVVEVLKSQGYAPEDIIGHVGASRAGRTSNIDRSILETKQIKEDSLLQDIKLTAQETTEGLKQRFADVRGVQNLPAEAAAREAAVGGGKGRQLAAGLSQLPEQAFVTGANVIGGGFDIISAPFIAAGRGLLTQEEEERVGEGLQTAVSATGLPQFMEGQTERGQRLTRAGLSSLDVLGLGIFGRAGQALKRGVSGAVTPTKYIEDVADRVTQNIEQQVRATGPLTARQAQDLAESNLTIKERLIGLQPDIKKRIQEFGEEGFGEYLDATRMRNVSDTPIPGTEGKLPEGVWGPQELGNHYVQQAVTKMDDLIQETGGEIGAVRNKLGTVELPQNAVNNIEKSFLSELEKLNLEVRNGVISQKPGKVSRVSSVGDINTMQDLYTELVTFKASPSFSNAIDLRMQFDNKVKFGKRAAEVSNDVDPLSRSVRTQIAKDTAKFIGKDNADALKRYSDFMDAYGDLKSYTDRAAGSEYLLRVALSGRGREARQTIDTIREHTDIDLMNHATGMKVAVDTLGNQNQQNLFRQEIAKAGADVAALASGSTPGLIGVISRRAVELGVDPEDVLRGAARGGIKQSEILEPKGFLQSLSDQKGAIKPQRPELKRQGVSLDKYNRLTGKTLDAMEEYVDFIRTEDIIEIDDIRRIQANTDLIADELGLEKGAALADDFAKILDDKGRVDFNKSATTKTTDLIEEAKKYDSAEEFVKAQSGGDEILYHYTNTDIPDVIKPRPDVELAEMNYFGDGAYVTNQRYGYEGKKELIATLKKDLKILDLTSEKAEEKFLQHVSKEIDTPVARSGGGLYDDLRLMASNIGENHQRVKDAVAKIAKNYDGIKASFAKYTEDDNFYELVVFEDVPVKTRTQLEDIWKQANN